MRGPSIRICEALENIIWCGEPRPMPFLPLRLALLEETLKRSLIKFGLNLVIIGYKLIILRAAIYELWSLMWLLEAHLNIKLISKPVLNEKFGIS